MLWMETPTNPLLKIVDINSIAAVARKHKLILVVDATFASPYFLVIYFGFSILLV